MGDGPIPAGRGVVPGQVAEIIVILDGELGRRGSGYRVGPRSVLAAAHVIEGSVSVRVRFDADLPTEWTTEPLSCWTDPRSDLAVLTIAPREAEPAVAVARFGRIGGERAAVLAAQAVGFPRFKLKTNDDAVVDADLSRYRDTHQADGWVAVLSNRREGTLELTVPPPERDPDPAVSPWEGMSGAAVWVGDRIVGVIAKHHRSDGLRRLAATRVDLAIAGLDQQRQAEMRTLLGLPDVLPDVVPRSTSEWVRSAYQAQVCDIAPDQLLDREAELDELVKFCAGDRPYAWWQAGPWAGKSALMSWFVLYPPAGVDVVSFFVTARLADQSDSDACTNALIEQLAALVGESPVRLLTAGARHGALLDLLKNAAARSREVGRRLLLVVDGLDEDSRRPGQRSIAALLPRRPPPEVRVLVASRPHPPIPDDVVTGDHPLLTITPRQLDVSEHARDVELRASLELGQLLAGEQLERDVLGFITAAGGGLTLGDLQELTKRPPFEIKPLLGGVFGRSVGNRTGTPSAGYPDERVYLLTHETLHSVAEREYGSSLATYRDQLHAWADSYRQLQWPRNTPHYLLRSYARILADHADLPRLVACATDQARHERMRDLYGGDALAFAEISTAQKLILTQPDPDLVGLALVAVQRDHLTERNRNIPVGLPAVWARIGQLTRAEALANSIPRPERRGVALIMIAEVVAADGARKRADALTEGITNPRERAQAFARLAKATAAGGDHGRAAQLIDKSEELLAQINDPDERADLLARLVEAAATLGDHDRAARLAEEVETLTYTGLYWEIETLPRLAEAAVAAGNYDQAETIVAQISDSGWHVRALARLANAAMMGGDHDRAAQLAHRSETLAKQITNLDKRAYVLAQLAVMAATGGDHDRTARLTREAEAFTRQTTEDRETLSQVIEAVASELDVAEALTEGITGQHMQLDSLAQLGMIAAVNGDYERAARLARDVEAFTQQISALGSKEDELAQLAQAVAISGDHERAETLTAQITSPFTRSLALRRVVDAVAIGGDHERAEALIAQITDPGLRLEALAQLAETVTTTGDHDRGARLTHNAQTLTAQITEPDERSEALVHLASAIIVGGDHERAEALTAQIPDPGLRVEVLARLVEAVATVGDQEQAARLIRKAEALTTKRIYPDWRPWALARLAEAVATVGDQEQAARLIRKAGGLARVINDPDWRSETIARLAEVLAMGADQQRAEALAKRIPSSYFRGVALAHVAAAVATSGDNDRAESLIAQIVDLTQREQALAELAETVAMSGDIDRAARLAVEAESLTEETANPFHAETLARLAEILVDTSMRCSPSGEREISSTRLMSRARHLLAVALVTGSWPMLVESLARVDPQALTTFAGIVETRWGGIPPGER